MSKSIEVGLTLNQMKITIEKSMKCMLDAIEQDDCLNDPNRLYYLIENIKITTAIMECYQFHLEELSKKQMD